MATHLSLTRRGPSLARRGTAAIFAASMVFGAAACGDDDDAVDLDVDEEQLEEDIDEGIDDIEEDIDEGADEIEEQIDEGGEEGNEE